MSMATTQRVDPTLIIYDFGVLITYKLCKKQGANHSTRSFCLKANKENYFFPFAPFLFLALAILIETSSANVERRPPESISLL